MTNPTTEAQMREAFEKWAKKERPCWNLSYSHELCSYEFVYAEDAWRAWQAASAIPPGYVVVPVETAKDAERYRWLRDKANFARKSDPMVCINPLGGQELIDGAELDAAIDTARAQAQEGER